MANQLPEEIDQPTNVPKAPQAANSLVRLAILFTALVIAALLALAAIILPHLPQPHAVGASTNQTK